MREARTRMALIILLAVFLLVMLRSHAAGNERTLNHYYMPVTFSTPTGYDWNPDHQ
jgi:hypothetical protein